MAGGRIESTGFAAAGSVRKGTANSVPLLLRNLRRDVLRIRHSSCKLISRFGLPRLADE
jgi:hypothetical protein